MSPKQHGLYVMQHVGIQLSQEFVSAIVNGTQTREIGIGRRRSCYSAGLHQLGRSCLPSRQFRQQIQSPDWPMKLKSVYGSWQCGLDEIDDDSG